jgi:integrase
LSQRLESNFLNSIRSEATRKCYQFYFNKYREFALGNVIDDRLIVENQIVDFLLSLKKRGLVSKSVKAYFVAIAHYYIMNDIVLNKKKIIKFIDTDERKKNKNAAYTTEQIHKLLDVCDERIRAVILLFCSTGMRLAALPALKLRDLKEYDKPARIGHITVYQGYKEEYITFCTPECLKVIDSYLQYRIRCGEQLQDDAPLIREQFNTNDSFRVKNPKHVSVKTIAKILRQKAIQAGLITSNHTGNKRGALSKNRKDIPLIHGFRKFFNTALMNADVNLSFKELLMGHSVKLDDVYYDKNSEKSRNKLLEEYSKAIDYLTINEENRLKKKVEELTVRADKMQQLKNEIDELRSLVIRP